MIRKRSYIALILTVCLLLAGYSASKGDTVEKETSQDMQSESLTNANDTSETESGYPVFFTE